jgi:hypothetical protein
MRARFLAAALLAVATTAPADTPCHCDPAQPQTMKGRECSLCAEAEKEPADVVVFFRRDINPRKPNRWLIMPRMHTREQHPLTELPADIRTKLWSEAIEKGKSQWGQEWAAAYNGDRVRTQCHAHIHIGKLLPGVEYGTVAVVNSAADIVVPAGDGVWVHPLEGKLHVHTGEQITETVLLR